MNPCPTCLSLRPVRAAALLCLVAAGIAAAQTDNAEETAGDEPKPVDEIVVTAEKPGDRKQLDTPYEELMRERMLEELDQMQREEE